MRLMFKSYKIRLLCWFVVPMNYKKSRLAVDQESLADVVSYRMR
jgi:hypothetical protein